LARALMTIAAQEPPPLRFIAGADAIGAAEQTIAVLQQQIEAFRGLSTSLAFDEVGRAATRSDPTKGASTNTDIKRSGAQPSRKGPSEHFTGTVRIDPLFQSSAPARAGG
jgi:hypothetical protein